MFINNHPANHTNQAIQQNSYITQLSNKQIEPKPEKNLINENPSRLSCLCICSKQQLIQQNKGLYFMKIIQKNMLKQKMVFINNLKLNLAISNIPFFAFPDFIQKKNDYIIRKGQKQQKQDKVNIKQVNKCLHDQVKQQKKQKLALQQSIKFKKLYSSSKFSYGQFIKINAENKILKNIIENTKYELQLANKRQEKQIQKKKQSLQGLLDQISEKSEKIQQLQAIIRGLEVKLGKQSHVMLSMLEEDSHSLRKVVYKLQTINDKLNNDIAKLTKQKTSLANQIEILQIQNTDISEQNKKLKYEIFQLQFQKHQIQLQKKEIQLSSSRLQKKYKSLKINQKTLNELQRKLDERISSNSQANIKKQNTQSTYSTQIKYQNIKETQISIKLQAVFSLLFNIQNESYSLHSPQLFDEQQKQLLQLHIKKYHSKLKENHENNSDKIYGSMDSFLQIFQQTTSNKNTNHTKAIQLQIQKGKLIQKISQIKERQLHIRNVILNLLKSLQIKSIKNQTQAILNILCDYFEYSEQQRLVMLIRPKRFFGLI